MKRLPQYLHESAKKYSISERLLAAVIEQESGGNPYAMRYEPLFFDRYLDDQPLSDFVPPNSLVSTSTERFLRACSFGLMQIMGQVAREKGFAQVHLASLLDPQTNIDIGARILARHIEKRSSVKLGLLRYNGGGNKSYADEVIERMATPSIDYLLE